MDRAADLDSALDFVIGRIAQQAIQSGEPLNDEEHLLLRYMSSSAVASFDPETNLVPRNITYERVCTLAKTAYLHDRRANPKTLDWEFAFAVFALNGHPMWGLLQQAGLKHRRPWRDQFLLVVTAVLFAVVPILVELHWVVEVGFACAIVVLAYLASRRMEKRRLQREIESYRVASGVVRAVRS